MNKKGSKSYNPKIQNKELVNSSKGLMEDTFNSLIENYNRKNRKLVIIDDYLDNPNKEESQDEIKDNIQKSSSNESIGTESFFNCFNENNVNNASSCNTTKITSSYVFDEDPAMNINNEEPNPFDEHELDSTIEKTKFKTQKNINRLGFTAFTAIMMPNIYFFVK